MATGNFVKLFGNADIPPLPSLATRLLNMFRDESVDVHELGKLIANDVGLSAKKDPYTDIADRITARQTLPKSGGE